MFSTSADILNLVLSVCVLLLTVFLCIAMYYFISVMHLAKKIAAKLELGIGKAEELVTVAREKIKNSSAYLMIFGELAKRALDFFQNKKGGIKEAIKKRAKKK